MLVLELALACWFWSGGNWHVGSGVGTNVGAGVGCLFVAAVLGAS